MKSYQHLGPFSDLVSAAGRSRALFPQARPGEATQRLARETLGFSPGPEEPQGVRTERTWERDGVAGEELSWSVGYGPRTLAWFLRPAQRAGEPLPGVVALHDHGGFKYYGKEKIADGPDAMPAVLRPFRESYYGGRAGSGGARGQVAVAQPGDSLSGQPQAPSTPCPRGAWAAGERVRAEKKRAGASARRLRSAAYNASTTPHEHTVEKYCTPLGATPAGVVSFEDRVATAYLLAAPRPRGGVGCVGQAGARAALLQATPADPRRRDRRDDEHLRGPARPGRVAATRGCCSRAGEPTRDWPDPPLAARALAAPAQYDRDDGLFTPAGMEAADRRIAGHYASAGAPQNYVGCSSCPTSSPGDAARRFRLAGEATQKGRANPARA